MRWIWRISGSSPGRFSGNTSPNSARIGSDSGEGVGGAALVGTSRAKAKQTGVSAISSQILRWNSEPRTTISPMRGGGRRRAVSRAV